MGYMLHWELGYPPHRTMGVPPQWEVGVYPQRELGYIPQKRTEITHTNINMHMKQILQKGMAIRILGILVAFFMVASMEGVAQVNTSNGSPSGGSGAASAVSTLVLPKDKTAKVPVKSSKPMVQTRNGGNILKITSSGGETEYADWSTAMQALKENDVITLLSDVTLYEASGDMMPDKPCTIDGGNNTLKFNTNGFTGSCSLQEGIIFQNIHLDAGAIEANGKNIVFDTGVTVANNCDVYGGGGFGVDVDKTSITIKDGVTLSEVYGGGYVGKVTGNTNIVVEGGTVTAIWGGGYNAEAVVEGSTNITIKNATSIGTVYGGGAYAPVNETANITIENGQVNNILCGGSDESATCKNTNLIISGGTFGQDIQDYRYHVMGGGYSAPVTDKAKVTISGGTFTRCFVTAGGGFNNETTATCGSTELNITGGTFTNWTYGGGWASPVLETATVRVSDSPNLITLCGGGTLSTASCNRTEVTISGGKFWGNVFGGGEVGDVIEDTHVSVTGGSIEWRVFGGGSQGQVLGSTNVVLGGVTMTANGIVFGGGWGDDNLNDGYSPDNGRVGSANVTINGSSSALYVYGNGFCSSVTNDINITINDGGNNMNVYGLFSDQNYALQAGGNVNIKLNGGKINTAGLVVNDLMKENTIGGKACITVSPDIDATNLPDISSGNPKTGVLKEATFVFKDCGSAETPFEIPYSLQGFTTVELDNSYVKSQFLSRSTGSTFIYLDINKSNTFVGKGWSKPVKIAPFSSKSIEEMKTLFVMKDAAELPAVDAFEIVSYLGSYGFFRVGNTYRVMLGIPGNDFLSRVTTDAGITNGSLSVSWKNTKLLSCDEIPFRDVNNVSINSELTIEVQPDEDCRLKEGTLKVYKTDDESMLVSLTGNKFILPDYDVTITAEFEKIPVIPDPEPDPAPTVYYTVTLPAVEGAITDPIAGDYDVESWSSFRFYLTLDKDYDQSEPVVTTDRGETIQPRSSDGAYIVKYVRSDVKITIGGIVKNPDPVANAEIQSGTKAWVNNHQLFIRTDKQEKVFIYAFDGKLRKTFLSAGGEEHVALSSGSYIVRIGQNNFKVIL